MTERTKTQVALYIELQLYAGEPVSGKGLSSATGTSFRTIQRHLKEVGTTFHTIHDEIRQEIALDLLKDPSLTVLEISNKVGYKCRTCLTSAVKRWTGVSPIRYRQQHISE